MPYWSGWIRIFSYGCHKRRLKWWWSAVMWLLACFARAPSPPSFNICVVYCALHVCHCVYCVTGALLCLYTMYSASVLRWFLSSILEIRLVWVCGVRRSGNLTILNVKSKGVRRARTVLGGSEARDPRWCGGAHLPAWVLG